MARTAINNGETGLVVRNALNSNFTELYNSLGGGAGAGLALIQGGNTPTVPLSAGTTNTQNLHLVANNSFGPNRITVHGNIDYVSIRNLNLQQRSNSTTNTFCGVDAGNATTTGVNNVALGQVSLFFNVSGSENIAVGYGAMYGNLSSVAPNDNIAVGTISLQNCRGYENVGVGQATLNSCLTGYQNIAVGAYALSGFMGTRNVGVGHAALFNNKTGDYNTAVGGVSLYNVTTGADNTALGHYSAINITTGSRNVGVGPLTLTAIVTGSNNTAIGYQAGASTAGDWTNTTCLGYQALATGDNTVRIGNTGVTSVVSQVGSWSDGRDKADVRDTILGLNFINTLRPVDFKWDYREDYDKFNYESVTTTQTLTSINGLVIEYPVISCITTLEQLPKDGSKKRVRYHHGLIAQEVKQAMDTLGIDFGGYQDHTIKGGKDALTIGYFELIGPLIKAIQELSSELNAVKAQLSAIS